MRTMAGCGLIMALTMVLSLGCGAAKDAGETASGETGEVTLAAYADQKLCGDCGHAFPKADEHACDSEHASCQDCGLHEGSELCCKLGEAFAGQVLCGSCGQVAGTEVCCAEGAEVCADCGLHNGAPLCCKLVSHQEEATGEATAETPESGSPEAAAENPEAEATQSQSPEGAQQSEATEGSSDEPSGT